MATKTAPTVEIPPILKAEDGIALLRRQINAADAMLGRGRPIDDAEERAWRNTTIEFLVQVFGRPSGNVDRFEKIGTGVRSLSVNGREEYGQHQRTERLRERKHFLESCREQLQVKLEHELRAQDAGAAQMESNEDFVPADPKKVFIVHGRNDAARKAIFDFLRTLGLAPMEWNEVIDSSGKGAPYVGEAIDAAFRLAKAVVVVLTGDDEARLRRQFCEEGEEEREKSLTRQARPNVLFEAGLALGRHPDNTILVQVGTMRSISDIAGLHLVRYTGKTEGEGDFRNALATRLERAGCDVSKKGSDWLTAGDFRGALEMQNRKDPYE